MQDAILTLLMEYSVKKMSLNKLKRKVPLVPTESFKVKEK